MRRDVRALTARNHPEGQYYPMKRHVQWCSAHDFEKGPTPTSTGSTQRARSRAPMSSVCQARPGLPPWRQLQCNAQDLKRRPTPTSTGSEQSVGSRATRRAWCLVARHRDSSRAPWCSRPLEWRHRFKTSSMACNERDPSRVSGRGQTWIAFCPGASSATRRSAPPRTTFKETRAWTFRAPIHLLGFGGTGTSGARACSKVLVVIIASLAAFSLPRLLSRGTVRARTILFGGRQRFTSVQQVTVLDCKEGGEVVQPRA